MAGLRIDLGCGARRRTGPSDLARLGTARAADLLHAGSGTLALAASLTDSRRNVKLATEAFALGL